ncbi:MAG: bifunctional precorrin-2 dehydrogenase/sirohydrochlorin ferrochelatase [Nitrospira sp.]|nr:bifunctional precorrin-2 dehydrogenase/sirohydrochlorin ferrochelatase [Nitrospira sp.]MDE0403770.1 bifunctional precorrin-2 dehydrogenase/sirohydrochlorin ferrochelatase [Nitrospira sp.]MDE0486451.1 bifunctional precorrin-2 dehydrogenase/sirohydrochlorin ferrochelatase [Nitrospira sp.]
MNNAGFQISLDLYGRLCVVIGGEDEAAHKTGLLLDVGAKVTVVNPTLNVELRKFTAAGKVLHRGRRFRSTDTQGAFVVLNTLQDDQGFARSLRELSEAERFLVWSIDQPELSNFMMPALVRRGSLRMAISTGGASPALAGTLRRNGEEIFDEEFERYLDWLGELRKDVQANEPSVEKRRERLKAAVEGFQLTGTVEYPAAWLEQKASRNP